MATTRAPKSKLLAVAPESVEPKKPKVIIFGPPGVGKTWTSLEFPGVFYADTEGGADLDHYRAKLRASGGAYFGPDQGSLDFDTMIGQVEALATEKHQYKTLVIDTISKLFNTAILDEQTRLGDKDAFGASKKAPIRQMGRLLRWINRADMNVIIIAQQRDEWGMTNGQREVVGQTFDAWDKVAYDLHLVLRISKLGSGENAKRFAHIGKSRLISFPEGERFDWSYAAFAERYGRAVVEKEVVPVALASPEQTAEITALLERVKVPDDWQAKCFKKAEVEDWAEMDAVAIGKCIDWLKDRATPPTPPAAEAKPKDAAA